MGISDHSAGLIGAVASFGGFLGIVCGALLRFLLRVEHRFTRLEQAVFGKEETPT